MTHYSKQRRHFKSMISMRFRVSRSSVTELEQILMRKLFMGELLIIGEDDRGLKIWFPLLGKDTIFIFNRVYQMFITGYSARRGIVAKQYKLAT